MQVLIEPLIIPHCGGSSMVEHRLVIPNIVVDEGKS